MALTPGSRLGPYEVLAPIGAGGMGEVYRARDTRLNRDVALKVLPDVFSGDGDRRARFEREAQLLATLNHPHIAQIYGLEDSAAGIHALVMELVDGPTLADRIAQGPIPVDEALAIARQVAEALEAAHDRGVIHRDLKPANVKMTADGAVKVLDFGLAKLIEPTAASGATGATAQSPLTLSPTLSVQATYAGVLLGTAAYMSPEQARGRSVDHRADVWAFGCVVYEMLTAVRPFAGDDLAETIGAVIHKPVDWSRLPANTPSAVRVTLERCLEKDPKRRLRDIGDVRLALSGAFETPAAPVAVAPSRRSRSPVLAGVAGALAVGATAAALVVWAMTRPPAPRVWRFAVVTAAGQQVAGTNADRQLAMSPDGRRIVYVSGPGTDPGGGLILWPFDRFAGEALPGITQARAPFFSPDSEWVGFFGGPGGSELRKVAVSGGPAIPICPAPGGPRGATWTRDGTIIFATNTATTGLFSVPAAGGEPKMLTKPDAARGERDHIFPSALPAGNAVLFTITGAQPQVAVLELATGRQKVLIPGATHAEYLASGHLVYAAAGTLRAVRFDPEKLVIVGEGVPVVDQVAVTNTGAAQYAVSQTGSVVYIAASVAGGAFTARELVWVTRAGGRQEALGAEARPYTYPRLSPDESALAVNILDQQNDVWVWDLRRRTLQRITFDASTDFAPVWTLDSRSLIFASARSGTPNLFRRPADGTGMDQRLTNSPAVQWPTGFTPDGKTLILHESAAAATGVDVRRLVLENVKDGKGATEPVVESPFNDEAGEVSPDGRFIAYHSDRSGRGDEVYVQPYPNTGDGLWQVSKGGGTRPVWSKDGREIFYLDPTTAMMSVTVHTKPSFSADNPTKLFDGPWYAGQPGRIYDVSRDGRRFLMIKAATSGQGAPAPATPLNVVLNWTEELKQRLPR